MKLGAIARAVTVAVVAASSNVSAAPQTQNMRGTIVAANATAITLKTASGIGDRETRTEDRDRRCRRRIGRRYRSGKVSRDRKPALLVAGPSVFVIATKTASPVAAFVVVGIDGVKPPM